MMKDSYDIEPIFNDENGSYIFDTTQNSSFNEVEKIENVYVIWNLNHDVIGEMCVVTEDKFEDFIEKYRDKLIKDGKNVINTIRMEERVVYIIQCDNERESDGFEYQLISINENI